MTPMPGYQRLIDQLKAYKRKFYVNRLLRGSLWSAILLLFAYLLFVSLEYGIRFSSAIRGFLFFSFLGLVVYVLILYVINPLLRLIDNRRQLSSEEAAQQIGKYFPEVGDKLVNTLQLQGLSHEQNSLISASIEQRSTELNSFTFTDAIPLQQNWKYLKYLAGPVVLACILLAFYPQLIREGSGRIIHYQQEFIPQAPFQFELANTQLTAFRNEDYTVNLELKGSAIPDGAYILVNGRRLKMSHANQEAFQHTFSKIQQNINFQFEAAGFYSTTYQVEVVNRPNLKSFNVRLDYPSYLRKPPERLSNIGNLQVPEGTQVNWQFLTLDADSLHMDFLGDSLHISLQPSENQVFEYQKGLKESEEYRISLFNEFSSNREAIQYAIDVIPDQYPTISLEQFQDTTLFDYIILGGNISDDYGLSGLSLHYRLTEAGEEPKQSFEVLRLPINSQQISQSYYQRWQVDSFGLAEGDRLEYFLQVLDNDGVNGRKATRTQRYTFALPSKEEIAENLERVAEQTENKLDETLEKAQELREQLEEAEERLRGKNELDWRDENQLEKLLEQRQELEQAVQEMQEQMQQNLEQQESFQQPNEALQEKMESLQELLDQVLDEETRKMWEELQKLLNEQAEKEQIQDMVEDLNQSEKNMEQELDRTLELFKRLQTEMKLEESLNNMEELQQKQENLEEKTGDESQNTDELAQEQEQLQKDFEEIQEQMDEFRDLNQELKRPTPLQDTFSEEESIEKSQEESQESLEQGERQQSQQSQQNATQQMQQMKQQMQQMQSGGSMGMQQQQENLDNLRDIVDNLIKLSFSQEDLINDFRGIQLRDPRVVDLSQRQLKLYDDARIIEDSLLSLAERVFQIKSFVTRELNSMNDHMENTVEELRDRNFNAALSEQQFSMTSMNNLGLLLDDVLQQMQQQMAQAMGSGQGSQSQPTMPGMDLGKLQQQLSQQIQDLQQSGKSGRQLSEELAKLAAEQERLRQAMQKMEQMMRGQPGSQGVGDEMREIMQQMEQSEIDLVNKRLTRELIERQKSIATRLLETEQAFREQEMDPEREAQQAQEYDRLVPEAFEEYIRAKQKEIELLKSVPLELNPYYKKEVSDYFKRLNDN